MQKSLSTDKPIISVIIPFLNEEENLPLITAAVHTAFAFPILLKLLNILMLSNTGLFVLCSIITFALFAIVYTAVYFLTSKTYYKIVH